MKKTIRIKGAGLAGLTAAINLARAGYKTEVYEKKNFIGQQKEENPQLLPNWFAKKDVVEELEDCNIKINWIRRLKKIEVYLPRGRIIFNSKKVPIGYVVLRGGQNSFEKDLAQQAEAAGVKIVLGQELDAQPDIIATGVSRLITIGYGQVYEGDFETDKAMVFFDPSYAPSVGYAYLFPHNRRVATLKISREAREKVDLKLNLREIRSKYFSHKIKKENLLYEFSTIRSFNIPRSAIRNNSLLIGEAAGFQDELFRFGMRYAIISGYLAAKAIIKGLDYDLLWRKRFSAEFERTAGVRRVFCQLKNERFESLFLYRGINVEIDRFKKAYLSPLLKIALLFYPLYRPFVFRKSLIAIVIGAARLAGILTVEKN